MKDLDALFGVKLISHDVPAIWRMVNILFFKLMLFLLYVKMVYYELFY
jgi:hypothetical protein